MPEIFMEYATLKQLKTLSLPNVNTPLCQVGIRATYLDGDNEDETMPQSQGTISVSPG